MRDAHSNYGYILAVTIIPLIFASACSRTTEQFILLEGGMTLSSHVLTNPYETAQLYSSGNIRTGTITAEKVQQRYGAVLSTLPKAGRLFRLYFVTGTTTLTPESQIELPHIYAEITERRIIELEITGYTDQTGDDASNDRLSLERAESVRSLFDVKFIRVVGRGSREPIIDAPGKDEPLNRRVEVLVR